ncbi:hypothetical protein ACQ4PT_009706 [Festuca glaucescens]
MAPLNSLGLSFLAREIVAPPVAVAGPSEMAARISPAVLFITVVLLVSGLAVAAYSSRPTAPMPGGAARGAAAAAALPPPRGRRSAGPRQFTYAELFATTGAKGGRQFDCAVCLCEFTDDDHLRLLPPCCHAFHVVCIDTWLASSAT